MKRYIYPILLSLVFVFSIAGFAISKDTKKTAALPESKDLLRMIRVVLIALNQANQTGNYTVLRDISHLSFQRKFSAARLGELFASLREPLFDLSSVSIVTPKLSQKIYISKAMQMHIKGYFRIHPTPFEFFLTFGLSDEDWKLVGLQIKLSQRHAKRRDSTNAYDQIQKPNNAPAHLEAPNFTTGFQL